MAENVGQSLHVVLRWLVILLASSYDLAFNIGDSEEDGDGTGDMGVGWGCGGRDRMRPN